MDSKQDENAKRDKIKLEYRQVPVKFRRAQNFSLYFANNVQIAAGQTGEVQIFFGQIMAEPVGEDVDTVSAEQGIGVTMTLNEFRRMLALFKKQMPILEAAHIKLQELENNKEKSE